VFYPYCKTFSTERESINPCKNLNGFHNDEQKKPVSKVYAPCKSIDMTFSRIQNDSDDRRSVAARGGLRRDVTKKKY
jgi:hypothetical protein